MSLHGIIAGDPRLAIVLFLEMQKLIHAKVNIVNDLIPVSLIVPGEFKCQPNGSSWTTDDKDSLNEANEATFQHYFWHPSNFEAAI